MQYDIKIPKKCSNQVGVLFTLTYKFSDFVPLVARRVLFQFSDLPEKWAALLKIASTIKYEIVPIQAHQIDLISKRITFFNQLSKHFRQEFLEQNVS